MWTVRVSWKFPWVQIMMSSHWLLPRTLSSPACHQTHRTTEKLKLQSRLRPPRQAASHCLPTGARPASVVAVALATLSKKALIFPVLFVPWPTHFSISYRLLPLQNLCNHDIRQDLSKIFKNIWQKHSAEDLCVCILIYQLPNHGKNGS
jgi:hypothetical protein